MSIDQADGNYPVLRNYLVKNKHELRIIAARAKISEGELREIVEDGKNISDEIDAALRESGV